MSDKKPKNGKKKDEDKVSSERTLEVEISQDQSEFDMAEEKSQTDIELQREEPTPVDIQLPEDKEERKKFFNIFKKDRFKIKQADAGAGFIGLIGFCGLFLIASIFFVTENYLISMFTISIGLLAYVTGIDLSRLLLGSFTIFFSSQHLNAKAAQLQETLAALRSKLTIRRDSKGNIIVGPIKKGQTLALPDNSMTRDLKELVDQDKDFEYAEYLAHSYYVECHELYESSRSNLDFVSNSMPLFGLIGTIMGLIAMFDSLGADVTVESLSPQLALALKTTLYGAIFSSIYKIIGTRFEQRLRVLEYDYETFCRALQVIVETKTPIEAE